MGKSITYPVAREAAQRIAGIFCPRRSPHSGLRPLAGYRLPQPVSERSIPGWRQVGSNGGAETLTKGLSSRVARHRDALHNPSRLVLVRPRAVCGVAFIANSTRYWLQNAPCIPSRSAPHPLALSYANHPQVCVVISTQISPKANPAKKNVPIAQARPGCRPGMPSRFAKGSDQSCFPERRHREIFRVRPPG